MTEPLPYTHQARKRFGQNFLHDRNIIDRIVKSLGATDNTALIEIGPGLGALTEPLLSNNPGMAAIEIDRDLAAQLRMNFPQLRLIEGDALKINLNDIITTLNPNALANYKAKIIGNLPYNISTPLIFHLLEFKNKIASMGFMLQREVVDRMSAVPGNKAYGKLSVMVQYHCEVSPLFHISPHCFHPVPKVESTFVLLKPRPFLITALNQSHFETLVSHAFQQRRKTLRNAIKRLLPVEIPTSLLNKLSLRAEEITVAEYVEMSNDLCQRAAQ
jgi:16S rRNA (adenine1518-N6/adenine1519-N6)-dimethyltransferase